MSSEATQTGTVKWFKSRKRFGFIERSGEKDVFVHISELPTGTMLKAGDKVRFAVEESKRGPVAKSVAVEESRDGQEPYPHCASTHSPRIATKPGRSGKRYASVIVAATLIIIALTLFIAKACSN